jgi:AcrR family transcriptional regulator
MSRLISKPLPPRARILAAAGDLFERQGIRGIGVEAIAAAADTNKMTLYRHFGSKDELVAAWISSLIDEYDLVWEDLATRHPGDSRAQLVGWVEGIADRLAESDERGCPLANSMAELPEKDHPARRVIARHKAASRRRIIGLFRKAGTRDPELETDQLLFLLEGARVCAQNVGRKKVAERLRQMAASLLGQPPSDKIIKRTGKGRT